MQDISSENITIRLIKPGDEDMINEFFSVMGPESRAFVNRHNGNQNFTLRYCKDQPQTQRFWMAEADGVMVGLVFLWDLDTTIPWLGIAVRENMKGKRLGRRLIAHAQEYVREHGMGGIQLTTHTANLRGQVLYETMGFQRVGIHGASGEVYYLFRFKDGK